jgi:hypothetical protein
MKRLLWIASLAIAALVLTGGPALASATTLQSFASSSGAKVVIGSDGTSATITLDASTATTYPNFGGVFINSKSQSGKPLSAVSFSFVSTGDVAGGAPRFSIPINTDGVGSTNNGYAFLDVLGCNSLATSGTMVTVNTALVNCHVNFASLDYANWGAFAAANPTFRIGPGFIPFIIADGTAGNYAVSSIDLR